MLGFLTFLVYVVMSLSLLFRTSTVGFGENLRYPETIRIVSIGFSSLRRNTLFHQ